MVVKRWTCLRDRYEIEKRQENVPVVVKADRIDNFILPRASRSNYNICEKFNSSPSPQPSTLLATTPLPSPVLMSSPLPSPRPLSSPLAQTSTSIDTSPAMQELFTHKAKNFSGKRKRQDVLEDDGLAEAVGVFKKLCETRIEKLIEEENDPLQGFGQMIVETIISMEPAIQVKAMQKVTAVVTEMKLEQD